MDAATVGQETLRIDGLNHMFTPFDQQMMHRALELAARGRYTNHPNPRVGCVIVQGERVVGEGWHRKWGEPHAEPIALTAAGEHARGSTVYVTLEPHSFQGRTPPCTDALIRAGVKRVICGALDPNPKVAGAGVEQLRAAGIDVLVGLLEAEAFGLNRGFDKRMRLGMPRVLVKIGASLDGRIALANGVSRWITGEAARADVHRLRAESSAVMTGIGTVLADDPQLTVRDPQIDLGGRIPLRIILDSKLRTPNTARVFADPGEVLVIADREYVDGDVANRLRERGAIVEGVAREAAGRLALREVFRKLGEKMCNDVLVEAGPILSGQLIEQGLVDELIVYMAPKLLGHDARAMVHLPMLSDLEQALQFSLIAAERLGSDMKLVYEPVER